MGNSEVKFDRDNLIIGREEYEGTPGLWELIRQKKNPMEVLLRMKVFQIMNKLLTQK